MTYQILTSSRGYCVRRKWFNFGMLVDITEPSLTWGQCDRFSKDCFTQDIKIARKVAASKSKKHRAVQLTLVEEYKNGEKL